MKFSVLRKITISRKIELCKVDDNTPNRFEKYDSISQVPSKYDTYDVIDMCDKDYSYGEYVMISIRKKPKIKRLKKKNNIK